MNLTNVLDQLENIENKLKLAYPELEEDQSKYILARSAKVSEEYGELMDEVLQHLNLRKLSTKEYDPTNLGKEFADTLISLLLLGMSLKLDVSTILASRIKQKQAELSR